MSGVEDRTEGTMDKAKGKVKKAAGDLTGNRKMKREGQVDEKAGKIFCLVDAPSKEAAHTVHRNAHGLVADEIYEVQEG